jgi:DNA-directed RNA polymerase subunit H (RpoH/RPB5)
MINKFEETLNLVMQEIKKEVLPKIKLKEPIIYYGCKNI